MTTEKLDLFQERNFGDQFNVTIAFLKQNFKLYAKTIFKYVFPLVLLSGFAIGFLMQSFDFLALNENPEEIPDVENIFRLVGSISVVTILYFIGFIMMISIAHRYVQLYVQRDTLEGMTTTDLWNESKGNLGWITGYFFLLMFGFLLVYLGMIGICVLIGMFITPFLLIGIVPLFIWAFFYMLIPLMYVFPLKMEEPELGFSDIVRNCFKIAKNNWWKSFGVVIAFNFILSAISYVFLIPMYITMFSLEFMEQTALTKFLSGLNVGISYGLTILTTSFIYIAISVLFYSLYDRVSGDKVREKIDSIGLGKDFDTIEGI